MRSYAACTIERDPRDRPAPRPEPKASEKQIAFLQRLMVERGSDVFTPEMLQDLTVRQASRAIDSLLQMPKVVTFEQPGQPARERVSEPGIYRTEDGTIYKVQRSKENADRLYAKKLTQFAGQRLTEEGETVSWKFVYAQGAMAVLSPAMRVTPEQAKAFGLQFGVCCVCGRTLVDAKSVAAGIGPVCAKNL